jgi:hypothetical protein
MADAPEKAAGKGLEFLKQKVGPAPLWVWLGGGIGIWYYLQRRQAAAAASSASSTGMVTDPAGNQCASGDIDSLTGYCTGTTEDLAALAQQQAASSGSPGTGAGGSGTSGAQTYADDNSWGIAAISYLETTGIDATSANQAIQQFLNSQPLTSAQQGDVNLAIAAIGPPPVLPGPVQTSGTTPPPAGGGGTTPPPVKTPAPPVKTPAPPKKAVTAPVPTGLTVSAKHSTSLAVKWNASKGATGYHVLCTDMATKKVTNQFDVPSSQTNANCGGLTPSHSYVIDVWAAPPTSYTGAHAEVSTTLPKTG